MYSVVKGRKAIIKSPYSGKTAFEVPLLARGQIQAKLAKAHEAQQQWKQVPLSERIALCDKFLSQITSRHAETIAKDISAGMGKPVAQAMSEVEGMKARARAFMDLAPTALAPETVESAISQAGLFKRSKGWGADGTVHRVPFGVPVQGRLQSVGATAPAAGDVPLHKQQLFERAVTREPVGVVSIISPWNYPLLTTANALIPAVLAGNAALLKPSPLTATTADHLAEAMARAGFPEGLVQAGFCSHEVYASTVLPDPRVGHVVFTGSPASGHQVYASLARERLVDATLELGGKDAMYVAPDADVEAAALNAIDGAMYNAGQSCCAVQRVFVHESVAQRFIDAAVVAARSYREGMGDPAQTDTKLGPVAQPAAIKRIHGHVVDALRRGATAVVGGLPTHARAYRVASKRPKAKASEAASATVTEAVPGMAPSTQWLAHAAKATHTHQSGINAKGSLKDKGKGKKRFMFADAEALVTATSTSGSGSGAGVDARAKPTAPHVPINTPQPIFSGAQKFAVAAASVDKKPQQLFATATVKAAGTGATEAATSTSAKTPIVRRVKPTTAQSAGTSMAAAPTDSKASAARAPVVSGAHLLDGHPAEALFFAPTILVNCSPDWAVMQRENFGPVLAVCTVKSDDEAVMHINNSKYGLTASVWTADPDRARILYDRLNVGTVFMNRCDYVDPYLCWTGTRLSGKGASVGLNGFRAMTRPKSAHFKYTYPRQ